MALEEIKMKLKEEQKKMKEERHKEYLKMLKERQEALEEADELDHLVTSKVEALQYDHPGHTVTVTTISDLDLDGTKWLTTSNNKAEEQSFCKERNDHDDSSSGKHAGSIPRKANNPLLSKRISSLTASLHARSKKKLKKGKQKPFQENKQSLQKIKTGKTSRSQRRRRAGNLTKNVD